MKPDPDYLRAVFNRLERMIEDRWDIPVHIQDVPNPFTGDLDGEQIMDAFPLAIPEFRPTRWLSRQQGTVV